MERTAGGVSLFEILRKKVKTLQEQCRKILRKKVEMLREQSRHISRKKHLNVILYLRSQTDLLHVTPLLCIALPPAG